MRKTLGAGVLIAGVAEGAVHRVETTVAGRDITARGIADDAAERDAIIAALDEVHGRRAVRDEIEVLETIRPYTLSATRDGCATAFSKRVQGGDIY